ncbi:CLUMA_CG009564, isoform A [Clunio marinus]|uniref:CLUMA_CG009564, isoform A n=1 Tax=Clunio marinus TaxID=568069 RepID=A0A1J1IAZ1_9DIPT|nr:CLUMA_CG009564, isoform A [Clunio marinus]
MFLMLIPQLAFKLPLCNQINLLCAAVKAIAINYMTTTKLILPNTLCLGGISMFFAANFQESN